MDEPFQFLYFLIFHEDCLPECLQLLQDNRLRPAKPTLLPHIHLVLIGLKGMVAEGVLASLIGLILNLAHNHINTIIVGVANTSPN